jgi:IS30 family transposase
MDYTLHNVTIDNDTGFAKHMKVADKFVVITYFTRP